MRPVEVAHSGRLGEKQKSASTMYLLCDTVTSSKVRRLLVRKWVFGLNISPDQTSLFNVRGSVNW